MYTGYNYIENFQAFNQAQFNGIVNYGLNNISVFANLNFIAANDPSAANLRFAQASRIDYPDGQGPHIPGGRGSAEGIPPDPQFPSYAHGDEWFTVGEYTEPVLGSFRVRGRPAA